MNLTDHRKPQVDITQPRTADRCRSVRQRNHLNRFIAGTFQKRHDMSLATAGWESGQGQCGHAVGHQSIDVRGPVDSVPHLSFQEWKSCRTSD